MLRAKKGSALLIVIGFLSFMIVSAVAFSIYMRAERLPSSALRRTVATRQLAKAALAEAISQIDDSLRGSPFPGLSVEGSKVLEYLRNERGADPDRVNYMSWEGRVFMPANRGYPSKERHYAPAPLTVSVLTLEAMGYIPPALVNDARFLGRASWSSAWQNFPYDAGRFAFVALNVSDFFDINRMYANKPRTSNADGRVSLAYLLDPNENFELNPPGNDPQGAIEKFASNFDNIGDCKSFDDVMHDNRPAGEGGNKVDASVPFVSDLDYQLALGSRTIQSMKSLFYNLVSPNGEVKSGAPLYYRGTPLYTSAIRQPFVTDSCTASNRVYEVDISTVEGQPFTKSMMNNAKATLTDMISQGANSVFFTQILKKMTGQYKLANSLQGLAVLIPTLYDYLDYKDEGVPVSLAWPCVERVPSLVNIGASVNFQLPVVAQEGTAWNFKFPDWLGGGGVRALWVYPFRRHEEIYDDTYKADAIVRIFLVEDSGGDLKLRDRDNQKLARLLRPTKDEWNRKQGSAFKIGDGKVFCITAYLKQQDINPASKNIRYEADAGGALEPVGPWTINIESVGGNTQVPLMTAVMEPDPNNRSQQITKYQINIAPFKNEGGGADGSPMFQDILGKTVDQSQLTAALQGKTVRPYMAVWARITNSAGDTVDLVPAVTDDDELNGKNAALGPMAAALGPALTTQDNCPMLLFRGNVTKKYSELFDLSASAAGGGGAAGGGAAGGVTKVEWEQKSYSALDPRFNWAPEDWYISEENQSFAQWLTRTKNYLRNHGANNDCDHDIFLSVSDVGFLQSIGEFAFLPRLTDPYNSGELLMASVGNGERAYNGERRDAPERIANVRSAWTSYRVDWETYEAFENASIGYSNDRECLVNPYTPFRGIFMAALANTPCDYWSTGAALDKENVVKKSLGDTEVLPEIKETKDMLKKYSFCYSADDTSRNKVWDGRMLNQMHNSMTNVLQNYRSVNVASGKVASRQSADAWKWLWDQDEDGSVTQMGWFIDHGSIPADAGGYDAYLQFLGTTLLQPLYDVDRKFLHSYWRECFANQQQLFLIFVRAESSAIGGPGEGTPAQKGARAVALVWRNPLATGTDGIQYDNQPRLDPERRPHQTRVLFYHQFD